MTDTKVVKEYAVSVAVYREDLVRLLTNVRKRGANRYTPSYLEERLKLANDLHDNIRECHIKLTAAYEPQELATTPYAIEKVYESALEAFEAVETHILDHLSRFEEQLPPVNTSSGSHNEGNVSSSVRLPKIDLPRFSGNYAEWLAFHDTFKAMIHDNIGLPGIQKFHYLKSCLVGEARTVIQALTVSSDNYTTAWTTLVSRYQNRRIITATLLNRFTQLGPIGSHQLPGLKTLRDSVAVTLDALRNLDYAVDSWDPLIVHLIVNSFDSTLRLDWERFISDLKEYPAYAKLTEFLSSKVSMLESLGINKASVAKGQDRPIKSHTANIRRFRCVSCGQNHSLSRCEKFLRLLPPARLNLAHRKRLCVNCLRSGHMTSSCPSSLRCRNCAKPHNTLLHLGEITPSVDTTRDVPPQTETTRSDPPNAEINTHLSVNDSRTVLLATVLVQVASDSGRQVIARGLVDPGSESSFVTENLVQLLRINRVPVQASISGVTGEVSMKVKGEATLDLHSLKGNRASLTVTALILPKITGYMPASFSPSNFPELKPADLADQAEITRAPIDFLIGADHYPQLLTNRSLTSVDGTLLAQSTIFGWVVSGVVPLRSRTTTSTVHCCSLEKGLRRFWELEEIPGSLLVSDEDQQAEGHFQEHVTQNSEGRFVVALPFRSDLDGSRLGASRHIAEAALRRMSKNFERKPDRREPYVQFMEEYQSLGHMAPVTNTHEGNRVYLPHHAVVKSDSGKNKVRVVFNASSKTSTGLSLNDVLLVGPKLQKDITTILLNWRGHKIAGVADIVKMFRQILVRPQDRPYQSILWQSSDSIQPFELNTVTYGTGPAPFLAMRVLTELADRYGNEFPHAQRVLRNSVYVDDLLFGADDLATLELIRGQLIGLLAKGGFSLSKWAFSCPRDPPVSFSDEPVIFPDPDAIEHKILGVAWDTIADTFLFQIKTDDLDSVTKRTLLSENSKIFDPMGWISPVTIVLKQLMQSTWLLKLSWDEEIPEPTRYQWLQTYGQLKELKGLTLPRWDGFRPGDRLELVGFCDASSLAYGAVVYSRVINPDGKVTTNLLMAKSKVAPIKTVSIPRLELVAAALLTKLLVHVKTSLSRPVHAVSCFTDSQVTLAWITQHPSKWKVFVANRVSYVQTELPEARWSHVKGTMNPADLNSRGISPSALITANLWWHGPDFIRSDHEPALCTLETNEERRKTAHHLHKSGKGDRNFFSRFSSWSKAIRIIAYIRRFLAKCRKTKTVHEPFFAFQELHAAKISIFRIMQAAEFQTELSLLSRKRNLPSRSRLLSLDPFLDHDGLIRVGGRLRNSSLSENEKHPVLLPPGFAADLLIRSIHLRALHGGLQLTLALLRKEAWIINARSAAKRIIHRCVVCVREKAALGVQFMGSLPSARVNRSPPFSHTGVDYAGPFVINISAGRGSRTRKAYIALFVCLATRAIHLELVSNYDTESFLAAFARFSARRGKPSVMYSDNGLNFQGANAELKRAFKTALKHAATTDLEAVSEIEWQFIPVASPHWGGIWESGVRTVKFHLKRVMGKFIPSFEEFSTILCRVEACLNSRPISPMHDDLESLELLSPGHFLIGRELLAPPEKSVLDLKETTLSRWQRTVRITEAFWRKWSADYLCTLQSRSKWRTKTNVFQPGDIVIIKNPANPPCKWSLGRILKLIPGVDSVSRVALVKTATKEMQRSLSQLCKLPVTDAAT